MAWIKSEGFRGVRFRLHPTRFLNAGKRGVGRHKPEPDRYYSIRFKRDGRDVEEALGWASEWRESKSDLKDQLERGGEALPAVLTEETAYQVRAMLQRAKRLGVGAASLGERRAQAAAKRQAEQDAQAQAERENITFGRVFLDSYFPIAKKNKAERSWQKEDQCYRLWIAPALADKPLKAIAPIHLERIKKNMAEAGRAARSVTYVLAVVRQVFNFARDHDLFAGQNPVTKIKKPSADNRRVRFLTHEEADRLLAALAERSPQVRDMALLSLHCGLRAGEVFALTWGDVDMERGVLTLRDTKSGKTRAAIMTEAVRAMFDARERGGHASLVFPARGGGKIVQVSDAFDRTVRALGLNDGVEDSRQKVVFHTLRHTFASWLVEQGVDLYSVKELMGHGNLVMTERYAHLAPDKLRRAVKTLEAGMDAAKAAAGKVVRLGGGTQ